MSQRLKNVMIASALIVGSVSAKGFAQNSEYQPPMGEQPVYGKRYTPGASETTTVFEINAAQLINKGIGLEFETRGSEAMNFGADILFSEKTVSEESGASASSQNMFIAPKLRLYPMQALSGVFLGGKLYLGQVKTAVNVAGTESEKTFTVMAPAVHIGYRMLATFGFTWSAYVGAGVNFPQPKFEEKYLTADAKGKPGVSGAIDKLNDLNKAVRFDLGITLGVGI